MGAVSFENEFFFFLKNVFVVFACELLCATNLYKLVQSMQTLTWSIVRTDGELLSNVFRKVNLKEKKKKKKRKKQRTKIITVLQSLRQKF